MELNRKLCASRRKLSQQSWLDDSLGCCLPTWYCPFITSLFYFLDALAPRRAFNARSHFYFLFYF